MLITDLVQAQAGVSRTYDFPAEIRLLWLKRAQGSVRFVSRVRNIDVTLDPGEAIPIPEGLLTCEIFGTYTEQILIGYSDQWVNFRNVLPSVGQVAAETLVDEQQALGKPVISGMALYDDVYSNKWSPWSLRTKDGIHLLTAAPYDGQAAFIDMVAASTPVVIPAADKGTIRINVFANASIQPLLIQDTFGNPITCYKEDRTGTVAGSVPTAWTGVLIIPCAGVVRVILSSAELVSYWTTQYSWSERVFVPVPA